MSSNEIYTGLWTDQSKPPVLSATWTLSLSHANILNSFLTFLITTMLFGSLWEITVFILYLRRPLPLDANPSIEKNWVILRNSVNPGETSFSLLKSLFSHENSQRSRRLALVLLFLAYLMLALTAGSFIVPSLIISGSSDDVGLLKSEICGFKTLYLEDDGISRGANAANELSETTESRRYASERYANSTTAFTPMSIFPVTALPFNVTQNEPCPFDEEMCLLGPMSAVSFDTGLLDSHIHLGINAPASDRIQYRWRSTCTILNITDKVTVLRNETRDEIFISADEPIFEVNLGNLTSVHKSYTFFYKQNFLDPPGYQVRYVESLLAGRSIMLRKNLCGQDCLSNWW